MKTSDFNYNLPPERIAQHSVEPRDHSKMMVIDRKNKTREHKHFYDILDYLKKGDLLVWNNSKVFKARLFGRLLSPTGRDLWEHKRDVEIFLVRPMENKGVWKVLGKPGKHISNGMRISFAEDFYCDVMVKEPSGTILVQFPVEADKVMKLANIHGHIPIPPYVKDEPHQLEMYQTKYAKHEGSVAAPTAGFHFTDEIIEKLKEKGIEFAEVTLHVGLGTFLPVKSERVEDHTMHAEWVEVSKETADNINKAKEEHRRIIAVGTTSVRTLEGLANIEAFAGKVHEYTGDINIFITPGFEFKVVDAMITNFHLPKSTLVMLVSALIGNTDFTLESYREAVEEEYRFYSFGDAMLIV
jgi:S-adenosylmethionine:tRNA ribosyltransferase-isomerase